MDVSSDSLDVENPISSEVCAAEAKLKAVCTVAREVLLSFVKKDVNLAEYPGGVHIPAFLFQKKDEKSGDRHPSSQSISSPLAVSAKKNARSPKGSVESHRSRVTFSPDVVARGSRSMASPKADNQIGGGLSPIQKADSPMDNENVLDDDSVEAPTLGTADAPTLGTTPPSGLRNLSQGLTANEESPKPSSSLKIYVDPTIGGLDDSSATYQTPSFQSSPYSAFAKVRKGAKKRGKKGSSAKKSNKSPRLTLSSDDASAGQENELKPAATCTQSTSEAVAPQAKRPASKKRKAASSSVPTQIKLCRQKPEPKRKKGSKKQKLEDEFSFDQEEVAPLGDHHENRRRSKRSVGGGNSPSW